MEMNNKIVSLRSKTWREADIAYVSERFRDLGITHTFQIMNMRVFDLLNMNRIDAETAKEAILALYRVHNPNTAIDKGMDEMVIDQYFPFADWRKDHRDLSKLTVRDLVMANNINHRAIVRIYNRILKAFFQSKEYDRREYRFRDYYDMLSERRTAQ